MCGIWLKHALNYTCRPILYHVVCFVQWERAKINWWGLMSDMTRKRIQLKLLQVSCSVLSRKVIFLLLTKKITILPVASVPVLGVKQFLK